jgi:hypothetical protein
LATPVLNLFWTHDALWLPKELPLPTEQFDDHRVSLCNSDGHWPALTAFPGGWLYWRHIKWQWEGGGSVDLFPTFAGNVTSFSKKFTCPGNYLWYIYFSIPSSFLLIHNCSIIKSLKTWSFNNRSDSNVKNVTHCISSHFTYFFWKIKVSNPNNSISFYIFILNMTIIWE